VEGKLSRKMYPSAAKWETLGGSERGNRDNLIQKKLAKGLPWWSSG